MKEKLKNISNLILWFLEGIIVGFGAIMPGLSGGTLCVAFGMYLPLIGMISNPRGNIRKYGKMLVSFGIGVAVGFVGLSGAASWLMDKSITLVTCFFIGLIIGTFPQLWRDAGDKGRNIKSYISILTGFIVMLILMITLQKNPHLQVEQNLFGFLLCGILWGLSFIVPGLSSSTLLLFFGLYQPMLDGISGFDYEVIIPLATGMFVCVILLSKFVNKAFENYYSILSHSIIGIVAATVVMIIPAEEFAKANFVWQITSIMCGGLLSYFLTIICDRIKNRECEQ